MHKREDKHNTQYFKVDKNLETVTTNTVQNSGERTRYRAKDIRN